MSLFGLLSWTTDFLSWSSWCHWTKTLLTLKPEQHENRMMSQDSIQHLTSSPTFSPDGPGRPGLPCRQNKLLLASQLRSVSAHLMVGHIRDVQKVLVVPGVLVAPAPQLAPANHQSEFSFCWPIRGRGI